MGAILEQLGINNTFFIQFGIFFVVFLIVPKVFFKPFLALFEERHRRTVEDRAAAEKLMEQAEAKFEEYKARLHQERLAAREEIDAAMAEARKQESEILNQARAEAKKITQTAVESVQSQAAQLKRGLETDVEAIAHQLADTLMKRGTST